MRRIKIFVTLVLLAMAALSGAIDHRNRTLAADYSCHNNSNCPGFAQCSGDRYTQTGCAITCYKEAGNPAGLIVPNGSANCDPPPRTGSGDGGGGGSFEEFPVLP